MMQNRANYIQVKCEINGKPVDLFISPDRTVVDVLRNELGLTGTKQGCDDGNCGTCTILVDGKAAKSCSMLIGQIRNKKVTTIEGVSDGDVLHPMQQAFIDHFAIQCGFCTPGMIMTAIAILNENPNANEDDIREGLHGNLCRCTGYVKIVEAVEDARDQINAGGAN
nr:(2Fe-2S)-binding protein [uncultured Acetobacterium sp.]